MNFSLASPAAMISRPMALASEMSEPTSSPSHTFGPARGAGAPRVHHIELRAVAHALQHMVEEDRMRLPRVRAPQQDDVRVFHLAIRTGPASRTEYRRQTGDARGVSSTVAAIDIVGAHHRLRTNFCAT